MIWQSGAVRSAAYLLVILEEIKSIPAAHLSLSPLIRLKTSTSSAKDITIENEGEQGGRGIGLYLVGFL